MNWGSLGPPTGRTLAQQQAAAMEGDATPWEGPGANVTGGMGFAPVDYNGEQWYRVGVSPEDYIRSAQGSGKANLLTPDAFVDHPLYGTLVKQSAANPAILDLMDQERVKEGGFDPFQLGPALLAAGIGGLAFSGAGLGGLAGGLTEGATLPESYWSMLANAADLGSDAGAVGAGTVGAGGFAPGTAGAFDAAGIGTGVDAGIGASTAGLGAGVTGTVFPSVAGPTLGGGSGLFSSLQNISRFGSLINGLSGIGNAFSSGIAGNQAANAANRATDAQLGIFNTINAQQAPYRGAGYAALGSLLGGEGLGPAVGGVSQGQFTHQFDANDLKTNLAPNYQFQLDQGLRETLNAANLNSGIGGNTLKAVNDYAQNFAGNSYQSAFNNYNANQTNIFNRLATIAGYGQTANQTTASAGSSISPGIANSTIAGGQAQAAGTIGIGNGLTSAANNAMGWYALPSILNAYSGSANA